MSLVAHLVVALVAVLHVWFLVLEMFLWTRPSGRRAFGLSPEFAEQSKVLAANQGLYNGFLAAGLCWGLWLGDAGRATVDYVAAAIRLVNEGHASAIVACPHSETNVNAAGIPFSGYPGLMARLTGTPEDHVFLMLVGGGMRIVHVTLHERIHTALARITPELVERAARTADAALRQLNIDNPRIGLLGINPHAGENGLFGDDDDRITVPAAKRLQAAGLNVEGPVGADLMLGGRDFDAFVAMYHDQGHIPVKLIAGRNSAAMSIGAGVLFASVGHGSAFDIAGKGVAEPDAVLRSLKLLSGAADLADAKAS